MNHKKKILYITLSSLLGLMIAYVFINPLQFGICQSTYTWGSEVRCLNKTGDAIGGPLFVFSSLLIIISFGFLFGSSSIFFQWWNFAKYYLPIAAVLIVLSAGPSGGSWGVSTNFDAELTTWWLAGIFILLSAWIIGFGLWQERRQRDEMPQ